MIISNFDKTVKMGLQKYKSQFDNVFPDKCSFHLAPSGRELSPKATEGECVICKSESLY